LKSSSFNFQFFLVLWLINPCISAFMLFRKMKLAKGIGPYLMISFFFGTSFVVAPGSLADGTRYANELKQLHDLQVPFGDYFSQIYSEDGSKLDIYQPLLTWLVSRFTSYYQWLFGFFSIVFGFFWFKSIQLVRGLMPDRINSLFLLLLLFFAFINPIWSINGVRMWTAVGVFFYGLLNVHFLGNKKGYLFLTLPLLIHFSLIISLALYLIYRFFPTKNITLLFTLYVLTFFVGELDLGIIRGYFELLPGAVQSRRSYLSEEYVTGLKENVEEFAVHIQLYLFLLKYLIIVLVSWIYFSFFSKKARQFTKFSRFFALVLVFSAFSNLASQIPSGGRFSVLSNLLVVFSFIWCLSGNIKRHISMAYQNIAVCILLFIVIVQIRIGADYFGAFLFIGNPMVNLFNQDTTPFVEFIKALL